MALPATAQDNFRALLDQYRAMPIEFEHLKAATLAQWGWESGWGKSTLASKYNNFAGMKWGNVDAAYGQPVRLSNGVWTYFPSFTPFIEGYWHRLDNVSVFRGWRGHTSDASDFLVYIAPGWLTGRAPSGALNTQERAYVRNVLSIVTSRTAGLFP